MVSHSARCVNVVRKNGTETAAAADVQKIVSRIQDSTQKFTYEYEFMFAKCFASVVLGLTVCLSVG